MARLRHFIDNVPVANPDKLMEAKMYSLLTELPILVTAAILFAMLKVIVVGRHIREGQPYDVAPSSYIGEYAMAFGILIGAAVLQRGGCYVPPWIQQMDGVHSVASFLACVLIGAIVCMKTLRSRGGKAMDIYHDLVVVPVFIYSAPLVPIIGYNGTLTERIVVLCIIVMQFVLFVFDVKYDRINQRRWLWFWCLSSVNNRPTKFDS